MTEKQLITSLLSSEIVHCRPIMHLQTSNVSAIQKRCKIPPFIAKFSVDRPILIYNTPPTKVYGDNRNTALGNFATLPTYLKFMESIYTYFCVNLMLHVFSLVFYFNKITSKPIYFHDAWFSSKTIKYFNMLAAEILVCQDIFHGAL